MAQSVAAWIGVMEGGGGTIFKHWTDKLMRLAWLGGHQYIEDAYILYNILWSAIFLKL